MKYQRKKITKKWMNEPRVIAAIGAVVLATTGCSLLSTKDDAPGAGQAGFSQNVSSNKNDVPLPVEVNKDLGRIIGGGSRLESGGSGKIQVNVNVNFNGNGWTKTVTQGNETTTESFLNGKQVEKAAIANTADGQARQPAGAGEGDEAASTTDAQDASFSGRSAGGKSESYVVKKGDTLMKISFEKYGNVYRWREILNANKGKISNYNSLPPGLTLQIQGVQYVVIERNGHPYLIRLHDTLGKISRKVYGTNSFWRDLWKNNPQLIRNPNKIYAGFTLYYRDKADLGQPIQMSKGKDLPSKRLPAESAK